MAPWWWFPCKPKHVGAVLPTLKCFNSSMFFNVVCISCKLKCWIRDRGWGNFLNPFGNQVQKAELWTSQIYFTISYKPLSYAHSPCICSTCHSCQQTTVIIFCFQKSSLYINYAVFCQCSQKLLLLQHLLSKSLYNRSPFAGVWHGIPTTI